MTTLPPGSSPSKQENMHDLLQKLSQSTIQSAPQTSNFIKDDQGISNPTEGNKFGDKKNIPPELNSIEELTKRLAADLGTNLLDSDSDEDDLQDFENEEEFRRQLLKDFASLTEPSNVSKQQMKKIYLNILKQGQTMLYDAEAAESFLKDLSPQEMSALWNILAMTPDETIQYFDQDPVVIEALKQTPSLMINRQAKKEGVWGKLIDEDEESDEEADRLDGLLKKASVGVKQSLAIFEENLVLYSTHPEKILELCNNLSQEEQKVFLDILFLEYSPEKVEQKLRHKRYKEESKPKVEKLEEIIDMNLVSFVFKEVLTHLKVFKKYPEKFDPLVNRLNPLEKEAFESLVKAFWDTNITVEKKAA